MFAASAEVHLSLSAAQGGKLHLEAYFYCHTCIAVPGNCCSCQSAQTYTGCPELPNKSCAQRGTASVKGRNKGTYPTCPPGLC
jgi:hypothetical protein